MGYETKKPKLPEGFTDLGEKTESYATPSLPKSGKSKAEIHYPELHFSGEHAKHLHKLGKHGTAIVHFKKVSESKDEHTGKDGKTHTHHRVGIQIHGIKPHEVEGAEEKTHKEDSSADAIEKGLLAAEHHDNKKI